MQSLVSHILEKLTSTNHGECKKGVRKYVFQPNTFLDTNLEKYIVTIYQFDHSSKLFYVELIYNTYVTYISSDITNIYPPNCLIIGKQTKNIEDILFYIKIFLDKKIYDINKYGVIYNKDSYNCNIEKIGLDI